MRTSIRVLGLACCLQRAAAEPATPIAQQLQQVLDQGIIDDGVRGALVAVIFSDGTRWTGTSGVSHDSVPIEPDMAFSIGSIAKNVVAALTLQLVEEGVLLLDDPVAKWLPPYPHVNGTATVRQLLNHTSGIYMYFQNEQLWQELSGDMTRVWTPGEVLGYLREPYFAPGEGWAYSNTNYLLLGLIIEKATESRLAALYRQRFWEPLGITSARLAMQEAYPENPAHVFGDSFRNDGSWEDVTFQPRASHDSIVFGSGGLFMNARDLATWCNALFSGQIVSEKSLAEMRQFVNHGFWINREGYGLSLTRFKKRFGSGALAIGHSGSDIGATAYMVYFPEHRVSVVVLINTFRKAGGITQDLIDCILREMGVRSRLPYIDPRLIWGLLLYTAVVVLGNIAWRRWWRRRRS